MLIVVEKYIESSYYQSLNISLIYPIIYKVLVWKLSVRFLNCIFLLNIFGQNETLKTIC